MTGRRKTGRGLEKWQIRHGGLHQLFEKNAQEVTFLTPLLRLDLCSTLWKIFNITQRTSGATGRIQTRDSENRADGLEGQSSARSYIQQIHRSDESLTSTGWITRRRAGCAATRGSFSWLCRALAPWSTLTNAKSDFWDKFSFDTQQIISVSGIFLILHSHSSLGKVVMWIHRGAKAALYTAVMLMFACCPATTVWLTLKNIIFDWLFGPSSRLYLLKAQTALIYTHSRADNPSDSFPGGQDLMRGEAARQHSLICWGTKIQLTHRCVGRYVTAGAPREAQQLPRKRIISMPGMHESPRTHISKYENLKVPACPHCSSPRRAQWTIEVSSSSLPEFTVF